MPWYVDKNRYRFVPGMLTPVYLYLLGVASCLSESLTSRWRRRSWECGGCRWQIGTNCQQRPLL